MHHILYTNDDKNPPKAICDRNGDVVLSLCKVCGRGEVELEDDGGECPGRPRTAHQTRALTKRERQLIADALRRDAERTLGKSLNPDLLAALVGTDSVNEEIRTRLTDRAAATLKKAGALEILADIFDRHGALISGPVIVPEQG